MNEETRPLSEAIEDEYEANVPVENRERWTLRSHYVEPVLFLNVLSSSIYYTVYVNTIEQQYCKAVLNIYNSSRCINTEASYFTDLQKYTSTFSMYQIFIDSISSILPSVFLGPWSDVFGRRPVLISCSIGQVLSSSLWLWGINTNLHPNHFFFFNVPPSLSGGGLLLVSSIFCYVCDTTTPDTRAQRLGILYGFSNFANLIGSLAAPYLIEISYSFTFAVCVFMNVVRLLYILIFLEESVIRTEQVSVSKNPFQWCHIQSFYETCYVKQPSLVFRLMIYIGLVSLLSNTQDCGEFAVLYLLLQKLLGWTLLEYTSLNCTSMVSNAFSAFVGTWFLSKYLSLDDLQVINIANGFRLLSAMIFAFSGHVWLIYIARVLNGLAGLNSNMIGTFLSRIVHSDDLGKVMVLLGVLNSLTPTVGSLIYTTVYRETLNTDPRSIIFLVSAFLSLLMALCTARIVSLKLRPANEPT